MKNVVGIYSLCPINILCSIQQQVTKLGATSTSNSNFPWRPRIFFLKLLKIFSITSFSLLWFFIVQSLKNVVFPFLVWCHNPINQGVPLIPNCSLWIKQSMVLCLHMETISSKGLVNCWHYWIVPKTSINDNLTNYVVTSNLMIVIVFI